MCYENHQDCNDAQNQLAVYSPADSASYGTDSQPQQKPYVGGYVAQCSICFKWRRLPSKEKYEEIREHGVFVCTDVPKWCPCLPCCNNTDLTDDGNWAIEKQNIQPPPGWERLVKIRDSDGDKYADMYV